MKALLIITGLMVSGQLCAQSLFQRTQYAEVGLFVHSFGVPFLGDDFLKLNQLPGISLGTSIPLKTRPNWQTDYRLRLSGYMAKGLHSGIHLDNQIVESYRLSDGFRLEGQAGLGYLHTFEDASLFEFDGGSYRPKRDWGRPQITLSIGLGFSFRMGRNSPYWLFAEQQFMIQLPFAGKSGVPMLMHNRHYLGIRREINQKFRFQ